MVWYTDSKEEVTLALKSFKLAVVWFKEAVVLFISVNCSDDVNTLSPSAKRIFDSKSFLPAFQ